MPKRSFILLLVPLLATLSVATTALADKRPPPPGYSLDRAVEGVRSRTGGRVLSADTVRRDGKSAVYDIKVLTNDGRVRRMAIDSETGEAVQRRPRSGNGNAHPRR